MARRSSRALRARRDLRRPRRRARRSPTFGQWEGFDLSDEKHDNLYALVGFADGFCVLSDTADVLYKQDAYDEPDIDRAFRYDDPDVAIERPLPAG